MANTFYDQEQKAAHVEELIRQGYSREQATAIVYAKPAPRSGKAVERAMHAAEIASRPFSLLK